MSRSTIIIGILFSFCFVSQAEAQTQDDPVIETQPQAEQMPVAPVLDTQTPKAEDPTGQASAENLYQEGVTAYQHEDYSTSFRLLTEATESVAPVTVVVTGCH